MSNLTVLNEQFGLAAQLIFKAGPGGLTTAEISNEAATARLALQGGHVLSGGEHRLQTTISLEPE